MTFIDQVGGAFDATNTINALIPATVAVGDLMIVGTHSGFVQGFNQYPAAPAGWTWNIDRSVFGWDDATTMSGLTIYWRIATLGDTGGSTHVVFTFPAVGLVSYSMLVYRGIDPVNPIDTSSGTGFINTLGVSGTSLFTAALNLTHINEMVVTFYGSYSATASVNLIIPPATIRRQLANGTHAAMAAADEVVPTSGFWNGPPLGTGTGGTSVLDGPWSTLDIALNVQDPPIITSDDIIFIPENFPYFHTGFQSGGFLVTATGNPSPTISADTLPPGLILAPDGIIYGTAVDYTGDFLVTFTATNGIGPDDVKPLTVRVTPYPIIVSDVTATSISDTIERITWTTDSPANSEVDWGLLPSPTSPLTDATYTTSHSIDITGLTPNTNYIYDVLSHNPFSSHTSSTTYTFTTAPISGAVFYRLVDTSSWVSQPQVTRNRHRWRGYRESGKVNLEINQLGYDIYKLYSLTSINATALDQNFQDIEFGVVLNATMFWGATNTTLMASPVGEQNMVQRVQDLQRRVALLESVGWFSTPSLTPAFTLHGGYGDGYFDEGRY